MDVIEYLYNNKLELNISISILIEKINYIRQKRLNDISQFDLKYILHCRNIARKNKKYELADLLRNEIYNNGWEIIDITKCNSIMRKINDQLAG